ncbi:hypothetical protein ACOMHN_028735 [Nucella lapillus]
MYNRREDSRYRIPSPAVTRRHFQSRDTQNAVYSDDPLLDHRFRSRDPSPGGIGRLSTSAPPGGADTSLYNRRYRDVRGYDHADSYGYVPSGASYPSSVTARTVTPTKDAHSRQSRPASSAPSSVRLVNGDAWSQPGRSRPRSFPEPRGTYLSDCGPHRDYPAPPHCQDLTPGGRRLQLGSYCEPVSPNSGDAMLREGMNRLGIGGEQMGEGSFTCDDGYTWHSTLACLTCYLCAQLFRRPRILPCGHTFCSECLAQLKDEALREGRRTPGGHASCAMESRQKADVAVQFVCPMPECRYSMRLINLSKWSTRNKTVAQTVEAVRRVYDNQQDACTQTDITMESMLVTIPRTLMPLQRSPSSGSQGALVRRNSTTSLVDRVVHRALSMDSLSRSYIPQQHGTWRGYAAMLGMHILQQALHT